MSHTDHKGKSRHVEYLQNVGFAVEAFEKEDLRMLADYRNRSVRWKREAEEEIENIRLEIKHYYEDDIAKIDAIFDRQ